MAHLATIHSNAQYLLRATEPSTAPFVPLLPPPGGTRENRTPRKALSRPCLCTRPQSRRKEPPKNTPHHKTVCSRPPQGVSSLAVAENTLRKIHCGGCNKRGPAAMLQSDDVQATTVQDEMQVRFIGRKRKKSSASERISMSGERRFVGKTP